MTIHNDTWPRKKHIPNRNISHLTTSWYYLLGWDHFWVSLLSWSPLYLTKLRQHKASSGLDEAHFFNFLLSPILLMFFFKPNCLFFKPNYFLFKPIYIMDHYMGTGTNIVVPGTRDTFVRGTFWHCLAHKLGSVFFFIIRAFLAKYILYPSS